VTPAPWGGVLSPDETLVTGGNQFSSPYFLFNYTTDTVQLADARTGQVLRSLVSLPTPEGWKFLSVTAEGHYLSSPGFAKELVYVVETDQGQETITPEEFSKRYGWKNDPQKVQLVPPGSAKQTSSPVLQAK
jgi:hypothetical protein